MKRKFLKKKKYKNPYLPKKVELDGHKKKKIKRMVILFILALLLVGLVYSIVYSPLFKIKEVVISGTQKNEVVNKLQMVVAREIEGYNYFILPRSNLWILNQEKLADLINLQITLDELEIDKKFPRTLKITAYEKIPALLWNEGEVYYYIDREGVVMKAVPFENIEYDLPLVNRGTSTLVIINQPIIEELSVAFIRDVSAQVDDKVNDWQIVQVVVHSLSPSEIYFYTNEGWYFILDRQVDIELAINNLQRLLEQKIENRSDLEYVDLRLEDRIFYKTKNQ